MLNVKQPPKWYQLYRWFIVGMSIPIFGTVVFVLTLVAFYLDALNSID